MFDDITTLALDSAIARGLRQSVAAGQRLVARSRVAGEVERGRHALAELGTGERLRLGGVLLMSAAATHGGLLTMLPATQFGVLPFLTVAAAALAGVALLRAPR